jgi:hypothetical protein
LTGFTQTSAIHAAINFSTLFGNARILPQIMDAIGITLVCVAALVVPALLVSRRQRNGLRRHRRDADGGFWFPGGNDSNAEQPHHHHHDSGSGGHHGMDLTAAVLMVAAVADMADIEPRTARKRRTQIQIR